MSCSTKIWDLQIQTYVHFVFFRNQCNNSFKFNEKWFRKKTQKELELINVFMVFIKCLDIGVQQIKVTLPLAFILCPVQT